jgi:hypothetical protein
VNPDGRFRLIGCLFSSAVVAAPFVGLLYGMEVGLAVLVAALGATACLAVDASRQADAAQRRRLRFLGGMNAILAVIALAFIAVRLL